MSAAHTPGPWSYSTDPNEYAFEHVQNERGAIVAKPMRLGGNGAMAANARLIAAAPEMLEALERIFSYVSYVNIHGVGQQPPPNGGPQSVRVSPEEFSRIFQEIGNLSSAAIAKAEGRS